MKLKILVVTFVFVLCFGFISVSADTYVPDMGSISGLGDLGYALFGGAEIDFKESSLAEYIQENGGATSLNDIVIQKAAEKFLTEYCIQRGLPLPDYASDYVPELPTNAKEYLSSTIMNQYANSAWNEYRLGVYNNDLDRQLQAMRFPISIDSFADYVEYSKFWYKKYASDFNYESSVPETYPDVDYLSYIETINGSGMDYITKYNENLWIGGYYNNSYVSVSPYTSGFQDNSVIQTSSLLNIYVTENNGVYSYSATSIPQPHCNQPQYYSWAAISYATITYYRTEIGVIGANNYSTPYTYGTSGSLSTVFNDIATHFKNVNIYVDGLLWAWAGVAPADPPIPSFPDVIGQDYGDPAYDIVLPDSAGYEGTFDLTSLFDAIKEALLGAVDNDDTTSGVLSLDDIADSVRDKEGELTDTKEVSMDLVVDDSFPIQGTKDYPYFPIYDEPIHNAFAGTTILAQLVDATQKTVPNEVIIVFWGIVFILFIIGLIKIFHK